MSYKAKDAVKIISVLKQNLLSLCLLYFIVSMNARILIILAAQR